MLRSRISTDHIVVSERVIVRLFRLVLGGTTVLPWNRGTYFSRYQYRRGDGTTVVPQYHKYRGTTVRYLPTNSHFSEVFRAKKNSLLIG